MRIVIDLQACQSAGSRFRGIGRYSRSLAEAMLRQDRGHEFWIALNGGLPDAIEEIRAGFDALLPQDRIVVWDNPFPAVEHLAPDPWRNRIAELLREDFLRGLRPDLVHVSSLFEGWDDAVATSIGHGSAPALPTAVTLYDLIPLAMQAQYLQDPPTRRWYERKLEDLRRADLCLAISDFSRRQGIDLLGLPADRVANISGACDPVFRRLPAEPARDAALRARHALWRPFTMYTGGFDPRKNVAGLVRAWAALPGALRRSRQLVVVGEPPAPIRAELDALVRAQGLDAGDVRFVGFVPDADLVAMYNACELYVFPSRCEGFGLPALEAMACGAPVIGADASSLPEVIGYPEAMFDPLSDSAMSAKIADALGDGALRARLLAHGDERVRLFSWETSATRALDAIARWHAGPDKAAARARDDVAARDATAASAAAADETVADATAADATAADATAADAARLRMLRQQSRALSRLVAGRDASRDAGRDMPRRLAAAQSANAPPPGRGRQLLVDVSNLASHDARTGIQRVVRNILRELLATPPPGLDVTPLYFDGGAWRLARGFVHRLLGRDGAAPADTVADPRPGDVFLGLDLSAHIVPGQQAQFERWRARGVALYFVVYDLIPLLRPDVVNPGALPHFERWYPAIGRLADGLCCISRAVADQLLEWCDQARPPRLRPLHIGHFHLGADLDPQASDAAAPASAAAPAWLSSAPTILMVGTLEPRKGYAQALAAFEQVWADGGDANLAIVGKPGWLMEEFAAGLRAHPEHGRRLHWLDAASDAELRALYAGSAALLTASEGEGFGLPIIEAARHGLPVIARDLPVFREVAGAHAHWFSGHAAGDLAASIQAWLDLHRHGAAPQSSGVRLLDWAKSAGELLALVLDGQWDAQWLPGPRHLFPANDPRLSHQVGQRERESWRSNGHAGFLSYGPYARLPAGRYRLELRGAWAGDGQAWCDVVVDQGRVRLAHQDLDPGAGGQGQLASALLSLDADATDLEVRLWVSDTASLALDAIELHRIDSTH